MKNVLEAWGRISCFLFLEKKAKAPPMFPLQNMIAKDSIGLYSKGEK
jgi:hypothetical protein